MSSTCFALFLASLAAGASGSVPPRRGVLSPGGVCTSASTPVTNGKAHAAPSSRPAFEEPNVHSMPDVRRCTNVIAPFTNVDVTKLSRGRSGSSPPMSRRPPVGSTLQAPWICISNLRGATPSRWGQSGGSVASRKSIEPSKKSFFSARGEDALDRTGAKGSPGASWTSRTKPRRPGFRSTQPRGVVSGSEYSTLRSPAESSLARLTVLLSFFFARPAKSRYRGRRTSTFASQTASAFTSEPSARKTGARLRSGNGSSSTSAMVLARFYGVLVPLSSGAELLELSSRCAGWTSGAAASA
mmetsp:Transcript_26372/g.81172  ORF Transcript_26372/g.81172 Transcript_26372/m.81172 type:complete len:299 (+) Transcript_26372:280-1176(+)